MRLIPLRAFVESLPAHVPVLPGLGRVRDTLMVITAYRPPVPSAVKPVAVKPAATPVPAMPGPSSKPNATRVPGQGNFGSRTLCGEAFAGGTRRAAVQDHGCQANRESWRAQHAGLGVPERVGTAVSEPWSRVSHAGQSRGSVTRLSYAAQLRGPVTRPSYAAQSAGRAPATGRRGGPRVILRL